MKKSPNRRVLLQTICAACFLTSSFPGTALAQIVISEIFYDAPGSDTGKEWVEIFNAGGSSVDLTGWKINDGSNHVLNVPPKNGGTGSMTLASGAYMIIADNAQDFLTSNSVSISVIDSVIAISNTAATVSLINTEGTTVDSLTFTKDTGAAGDGNSLHRLSVGTIGLEAKALSAGSGGLVASQTTSSSDTETPQQSESTANTASESQTQTTSNTSGTVSSYVAPPVQRLFVNGGDDRIVIVGADTEFRARAYNRDREIVDNVRFNWNFGDGTRAEGKSVMHHYEYPGNYLAVITIAESTESVTDTIRVTAEPAKLFFSLFPDGSVGIRNDAGRELDVSGWLIYSSFSKFMIPEMTKILPNETLRLSAKTLGFKGDTYTELLYPNGQRAFRVGEAAAPSVSQLATAISAPTQTFISLSPPTSKTFTSLPKSKTTFAVASKVSSETAASEAEEVIATTSLASVAAIPESDNNAVIWWMMAGLLALVSAVGVYAAQLVGKKEEWEIKEE